MLRPLIALSAALIAGFAFLGTATDAEAGYRRCPSCGPIRPAYTYRTVNRVMHKTRYRDVSRTRYVQRVRPIIHVTRVQPIVRVHRVTRVHHRTVAVIRNVHQSRTHYLPTRTYYTSSVRHSYDCGCR